MSYSVIYTTIDCAEESEQGFPHLQAALAWYDSQIDLIESCTFYKGDEEIDLETEVEKEQIKTIDQHILRRGGSLHVTSIVGTSFKMGVYSVDNAKNLLSQCRAERIQSAVLTYWDENNNPLTFTL